MPVPYLEVEEAVLTKGSTTRIELVYSAPIAEVSWFENGKELAQTSHSILVTPDSSHRYSVTFKDEYACAYYLETAIQLITEKRISHKIYAPNAFSPNGDMQNDYYTLSSNDLKRIKKIQILDRWGNLVFEDYNKDFTLGWDGSYNGKPMPTGVYSFFAEVLFIDGEIERYSGQFTLLR